MASHSILETDGYKFRMAQAGWPLRQETFYYSHRKGGWQYMPVDPREFILSLLPEPGPEDYAYLDLNSYKMDEAWSAAMLGRNLQVSGIPKGSWFYNREPVFCVTGPSALVSWLEPLVLQLNYRIQVATFIKTARVSAGRFHKTLQKAFGRVTCEEQKNIVLEVFESLGVLPSDIKVDEEDYFNQVLKRCQVLAEHVDPSRIFELGMRGVTCIGQHEIALKACKEAGIQKTSNVFLAKKLNMTPVGTMGHEHVQRYGSDKAAYMAMHERSPYPCSFLLDTFDTLSSGIPEALRIIQQHPERNHSVRYDSGDKLCQYIYAVTKARSMGAHPTHILMDGMGLDDMKTFEDMRVKLEVPEEKQFYGFGSYIVDYETEHNFSRNTVAAVWKLCQSGDSPTMKFADEANGAKESIPGKPVIFRNMRLEKYAAHLPISVIGQEGEEIPTGYVKLTGSPKGTEDMEVPSDTTVAFSPKTAALIATARKNLNK